MRQTAGDFEEMDEVGALSLERAVTAVRRRLKLVVALPMVALAISAFAVSLLPDRYDAVALVQIDPRQKSIANIESVATDISTDQSTIESEVEIIRSRPIALRVIERLGLRNDPELNAPSLLEQGLAVVGLSDGPAGDTAVRLLEEASDPISAALNAAEPGTFEPSRDAIAQAFYKRLKVARVRNTLLIEIRYASSDPVKAAKVANTIAEVYLKDQLEAKNGAAATAARLLSERIAEMRDRVARAERKVAEWKALNGVFESEGELLSEKQLARLMEQTVIARNATSEARAKYEHAQKLLRGGRGADDLIEVLKSPAIASMKASLGAAERRASELATRYGPLHPEMKKVQAEVSEARQQMDSEVRRLVTNLYNEAQVAERRERELAQSLANLKEQEIVRKDHSPELNDLERDAAASKTLYEGLLARHKQTSESQGFQLPDARIIEKADVPLQPAGPKRKQLVLFAVAAALVVAIGLALLLEIMTGGLSRAEDVEEALSLAHLASVPEQESHPSAGGIGQAVRRVVGQPHGRYAEAIRNARRELDRRSSGPARVIVVVSSMPGEGADVFASNLAHHYATTGHGALLIDADMRIQPLTRQLAPKRARGLLDQIATNDVIEAAILRDNLTGLNFLPAAGSAPQQMPVSAAVTSDRMANIFHDLKSRFGTVIVSVPPILPVMDARVLADYADQIVLVVGWQRIPRQLVKKAIARLGLNGAKIAGVVLTDVAEEAIDGDGLLQSLMAASDPDNHDERYRRRVA